MMSPALPTHHSPFHSMIFCGETGVVYHTGPIHQRQRRDAPTAAKRFVAPPGCALAPAPGKRQIFSESIVGIFCAKAIERLGCCCCWPCSSPAQLLAAQPRLLQPEHQPQLRSHREAHHPSVRAKCR